MAKIIMIGKCPNCGAEVTSRYPFEIALCKCENPSVQIPLKLAIVPSPHQMKAIQQISELSGISVEKLVNALLETVAKEKLTISYKL